MTHQLYYINSLHGHALGVPVQGVFRSGLHCRGIRELQVPLTKGAQSCEFAVDNPSEIYSDLTQGTCSDGTHHLCGCLN